MKIKKLGLALLLTLSTALLAFAEDGETNGGNIIDYIFDSFGQIIGYIYG